MGDCVIQKDNGREEWKQPQLLYGDAAALLVDSEELDRVSRFRNACRGKMLA